MAKVTLPAPAVGNVWRQVPASQSFHIDGAGKVKLDVVHNFDPDQADSISDRLLGHMIRQGDIRFVGTATTSAKEGESEREAVERRNAEIIADTYKPGQGGGARADTYTIVLRESVVVAVLNNHVQSKKAEAIKMVRENTMGAYRMTCDKVSESIDGQTGDSIFEVMWPKIEAHAKAEAARRDATKGVDFDLGDFAPTD